MVRTSIPQASQKGGIPDRGSRLALTIIPSSSVRFSTTSMGVIRAAFAARGEARKAPHNRGATVIGVACLRFATWTAPRHGPSQRQRSSSRYLLPLLIHGVPITPRQPEREQIPKIRPCQHYVISNVLNVLISEQCYGPEFSVSQSAAAPSRDIGCGGFITFNSKTSLLNGVATVFRK